MKKEFIPADLELVLFDTDVITTSGEGTEGENDLVKAINRIVSID